MNNTLLVVTAWLVLLAAAVSAEERPVEARAAPRPIPTEASTAASLPPEVSHGLPLKLGPDISAPIENIASR